MFNLKRVLSNPRSIILSLNNHGLLGFQSDKTNIEWVYFASFGKHLDLTNPVTFNEKIQWLKLYDRNPLYTSLVNKYSVKQYVKEKIGEQYVIPNYGCWHNVEEIDYDALPDRFVLKTTHDGGGAGVVICNNKAELDKVKAKKRLQDSLNRDVYKDLREWPYKGIPHMILAEQLLLNNGLPLQDYKIHCFNGTPKFILVCKDRYEATGLTEDFYDCEWNHIPVRRPKHPNSARPIEAPAELTELLELSSRLSAGIPFVRVDFYVSDGNVYFGEMTFYPTSGYTAFVPEEYDYIFGQWIDLSKVKK